MRVDINSDIGEGFGPWQMGNDAEIMPAITSANIACGFHAGDPDQMAQTIKLAKADGVGIGAHPGFHDLVGFGRYRMDVPFETLQNQIRYQIGALQAIATSLDAKVRHVKLHGALANMAAQDKKLALACYEAVKSVDPTLIILAMASSAQVEAADHLGLTWASEIFADRAYEDDGSLRDRREPGAVLHDPTDAAQRVLAMIKERAIITHSGKKISTPIDSICVHGDTKDAVAMARHLRHSLLESAVDVRQF